MEIMREIIEARADAPAVLNIRWDNGLSVTLDIAPLLFQPAFRVLQDPNLFEKARPGEWGHSVVWSDEIAIGADRLWTMSLSATGHEDAAEFLDWRLRNGLSLRAAADALGLSRRMVAYYSSGEKKVPKTVLLACKGWEVEPV